MKTVENFSRLLGFSSPEGSSETVEGGVSMAFTIRASLPPLQKESSKKHLIVFVPREQR